MKSPRVIGAFGIDELFMTVFDGFDKKPSKNTLEKVPFLLVRFLWAYKENEQEPFTIGQGFKIL